MINDFVGVHSLGANCQDDDAVLMDNLKNFIGSREGSSKLNFEANIDVSFSNKIMSEFSHVTSILRKNIEVYIALYVTKKVLKAISKCQQCKIDLVGDHDHYSGGESTAIKTWVFSKETVIGTSYQLLQLFFKSIFFSVNTGNAYIFCVM